MKQLERIGVRRELDRLGQVDDDEPLLPPQQVVGGEVRVDEPGHRQRDQRARELTPGLFQLVDRQARLRQLRSRLGFVADERHHQAVLGPLDRVGTDAPASQARRSIAHSCIGQIWAFSSWP